MDGSDLVDPGTEEPFARSCRWACRRRRTLLWDVPFHPNPFFTGRHQLLAELQTRLTAPDLAARRVVLTGLGGVGKTSLAVEYVYRHHADYDLVWCVNGEQPASLLADLAALAGQLGLAADASQEAQVAALRGWFERHQHWLLVLDNVDDPQAVVELLPRSATGQVVITSRTGVGWERLAAVLSVDVLAPADAAGLLLARAEETGPANEAAATTLAATLDGLPLALEQAGAYVAATGTVTLADYAELFATRAPELLRRGALAGFRRVLGDDHPDTLTSMSSLAMTRWKLGDLQGARQLYEQALAGRHRVLGDDHPDTLTAMDSLTAVRSDLGEL